MPQQIELLPGLLIARRTCLQYHSIGCARVLHASVVEGLLQAKQLHQLLAVSDSSKLPMLVQHSLVFEQAAHHPTRISCV